MMTEKTNTQVNRFIVMIGITSSKYYSWIIRFEQPNHHNGIIPKKHWILDWEKEAIIKYAQIHLNEGYGRLTYTMIDDKINIRNVKLKKAKKLRYEVKNVS